MRIKTLIILIILIASGAGGFFVYKNIFIPRVEIGVLEFEVSEAEKEEVSPVTEEKIEEEKEALKETETPVEEKISIEIFKDTKFEWGFANKFPHSNLPENNWNCLFITT